MKKRKCPHCHRKQSATNICQDCFGDMNKNEGYPYQLRQLNKALIINDIKEIKKIANQIFLFNIQDLLANYAYAYAMISDDEKYIRNFLEKYKLNEQISYHIINHINVFPKGIVEGKLYETLGEERVNEILKSQFEIDIPEIYKIDIKFREVPVSRDYLRVSLINLGVGLFLFLSFALLIVSNLEMETKYYSTIIYYIVPSLFIGAAITRVTIKKGNYLLTALFGLIVLIFVTYLWLLPESSNFIEHIKRVFMAPIDFINFYANGSWW